MRALILNLTRFGDLIQTQPVITGLREQGVEVGLVCLDNFAGAASLLDGPSFIRPLSGARLLALLDKDWRQAVAAVTRLKDEVAGSFAPDMVVNLTPSLSSRLLSRVFGPERILGFAVDEYGFNADASPWAAFLQMASGNRGASPFNVVDLFRRASGLGREGETFHLNAPDTDSVADADLLLGGLPDGARGFVGVQLGASEERRRWPVARFVEAGIRFWKEERRVPVLVGTEAEQPLGGRFEGQFQGPVVNLMGRTSLPVLAAALTRLDLLLTNDTGTMHLAAGLDVPVAAIFLATAQPFDTGPYREGCLCFEPDMDCHPCAFGEPCRHGEACRSSVGADTVFAHARTLLGNASASELFGGARVWRTVRDGDGFMTLESLSGHDDEDRARWIELQRWHYRRFLDGEPATPFPADPGLGPEMARELGTVLVESAEALFLLEQQGKLLSMRPTEALKTKFLASWQRFQGLLSRHRGLAVLSLLFAHQSQTAGNDFPATLELVSRYRGVVSGLAVDLGEARHES